MNWEALALFAIVAFAPFLPLTILYFWKLKRFPGAGRIVLAAAALEIVAMVVLWFAVIAKIPSSAALILFAVFLAYGGVGICIGILLCPICYLLAAKPVNWQRNSKRLATAYAIIVVLAAMPALATRLGIGANVDLYGRVTNVDGSPVANAAVHFTRCAYIDDNPAVTDENGLFRVKAKCRSYLSVTKIYNPETRTECLSRFSMGAGRNVAKFDAVRTLGPGSLPNWQDYGANNPYPFQCAWHPPASVFKVQTTLNMDRMSATRTLNLRAQRYEELFLGDADLELRYDSDARMLTVSAPDGGVQRTTRWLDEVNAAPREGYQDRIDIDLAEAVPRRETTMMFFHNGRTYGFIQLQYEWRGEAIDMHVEYLFNPDGANLVAHHREPRYLSSRRIETDRPVLELELGVPGR
jgi:hypothetical protein